MNLIDSELFDQLRQLREHAYAPYSHHPVAAVVETISGHRYGGCNVEVAHFKSLCAEASALSAMVSDGQHQVRRVYLLGPGGAPCPPCGDCRQRIREFAGPDTEVALLDESGAITKTYSIDELLPDSFGPEHVSKQTHG